MQYPDENEAEDFLRFLFELDIVDETTQLKDIRAESHSINNDGTVIWFYSDFFMTRQHNVFSNK